MSKFKAENLEIDITKITTSICRCCTNIYTEMEIYFHPKHTGPPTYGDSEVNWRYNKTKVD